MNTLPLVFANQALNVATAVTVDTITMASTVSTKEISLVLMAGGETRHVGLATATSAKASNGTAIKPQESVAARTTTFVLSEETPATRVTVSTWALIHECVTL